MVFYKYIGYGVTDENGVAKLDHDAEGNPLTHSYTGTGAGEVDVVASLDNPVLEGSIVSEIYEILDTIFYCKGATSVNPNWTKSNATTQTDDTGTEVALNETSGYYNVSLSSLSSGNDYCIEFDVMNIGNGAWDCRFDFCGANYWLFRDVNPTTDFKHYKIEIKNGTGKLYIDNQYQTSRDASPTYANTNVRYSLYDTCDIKYKNFVIYPI